MSQQQRQRLICGLVSIGACLMFWLGCQLTGDENPEATLVKPDAKKSVAKKLESPLPDNSESGLDPVDGEVELERELSAAATAARSTKPAAISEWPEPPATPGPRVEVRRGQPIPTASGFVTTAIDPPFDTSVYLEEIESIYSAASQDWPDRQSGLR